MAVLAEMFFYFLDIQRILVTIFLLTTLFYLFNNQKYKLPPGPRNLPLIGSLPSVAMALYRTGFEPEQLFAKLAKQYGDDVISLKIGSKVIVILNGSKVIKDAFQNPDMNDRPVSKLFKDSEFDEGILFTSGKSWKYQRALTMTAFRNFGVGRSSFQDNITEEAKILIEAMGQYNRNHFDPTKLIGNCVANVICGVLYGQRYDHTDPDFEHLLRLTSENANYIGSGGFVLFVPIFRYIIPDIYTKIFNSFLNFKKFTNTIVDKHKSEFDGDNIRDVVDVYLNEIEKTTQGDNDFHNTTTTTTTTSEGTDKASFIHIKSLTATAVGIFLAGAETTQTTLRWALLYMMTYPEVQTKVQQELDAIVGRSRMPNWADRVSLPFTEAVLLEVQRIRTVVPMGFPHVAAKDTKLGDYDVPKGSIIASNLWAVHNDPDIWDEPDRFQPERFIDDDGKLCHRKDFIPFSAGHRVCLGENLARMELFFFFTYILHTFVIKSSHDGKPPSLKGVGGVTFSPAAFEMIAERRE